MQVYPNQLIAAAKNLLDNESVSVVLSHKMAELKEDVLLSVDDKDVLKAHGEYNNLAAFAAWISHVAGHKMTKD